MVASSREWKESFTHLVSDRECDRSKSLVPYLGLLGDAVRDRLPYDMVLQLGGVKEFLVGLARIRQRQDVLYAPTALDVSTITGTAESRRFVEDGVRKLIRSHSRQKRSQTPRLEVKAPTVSAELHARNQKKKAVQAAKDFIASANKESIRDGRPPSRDMAQNNTQSPTFLGELDLGMI